MQTQNRLLDDLAKVASSAMGVAAGLRGEMEARLREQFERVLNKWDLVTRDEFEAVKAMAAKAREEQEVLNDRLAALEAKVAGSPPGAKKKATGSGTKSAAGRKPARKPRAKAAPKSEA